MSDFFFSFFFSFVVFLLGFNILLFGLVVFVATVARSFVHLYVTSFILENLCMKPI